jgi:hypothetical protein
MMVEKPLCLTVSQSDPAAQNAAWLSVKCIYARYRESMIPSAESARITGFR